MCPLNPLSRWSLSGKIINIFFYKIKVKTHRFEILFQKNCKIKNFFPTEAIIGVPKVQKKVYRTWLIVIKIFFLLYIFACKMIFLILFFYLRRFLYIWIAYGISLNINRFTEYRDCYFNHIWHLNLHSNVPHCALFRHTGLKAQIWPYKIFYMTGLGENENFETKNFRILIIWAWWLSAV